MFLKFFTFLDINSFFERLLFFQLLAFFLFVKSDTFGQSPISRNGQSDSQSDDDQVRRKSDIQINSNDRSKQHCRLKYIRQIIVYQWPVCFWMSQSVRHYV